MKTKLLLMVIASLFMTIPLMGQRPKANKFSIQLNTGYTWFSGTKWNKMGIPPKYAYGSFINGQIPIEAEFRYKVTPRFSLSVAYGYSIGLPYTGTMVQPLAGGESIRKGTFNLSTHTIRIGEEYYFVMNNKIRPYIGLDIGVLISGLIEKDKYTRTANGVSTTTEGTFRSQSIATFGLFPKIGFESNLNKNLFLNVAVHYTLAVPVDILAKGTNANPSFLINRQTPSHGVTATVGLGYRF